MRKWLRHLSPHAQYYWLEHGWLIGAGAGAVFIGGAYLWFARPDPYEVIGYVAAPVISSFGTSSDTGTSWRFLIDLPDNQRASVSTSSLALAHTATQTACIERRQHESGRVSHVLVAPGKCG